VEHLATAQASGQPLDSATADWLADIDDTLHGRIARAGLVEPRERKPQDRLTLGSFIASYIEGRQDAAPRTITNLKQSGQYLVDYFGAARTIDSITPGDADGWYQALVGKGYAPSTVGQAVKRARQFYIAAIRGELVTHNPFRDVKAPGAVNRERDYFVSLETTRRVINACPDAQWRLIVALSRYAGLRCPSEHLALTWGCVDWERDRVRIPSPKTGSRTIPLFPELRPYLEEAFDLAEPGDLHVITRYRDSNMNLRTQLLRIMDRAGVEPWPKLFHNMRASRETELCQTFPLHVVCQWIGNSTTIAAKHYLQVTEDHFTQAAGPKAQHNAQQSWQAAIGRNPQEMPRAPENQGLGHVVADDGLYCTSVHVPPRGVEPLSSD